MRYACSACRGTFPRFQLSCPDCGGWKTIARRSDARVGTAPCSLAECAAPSLVRRKAGIPALDTLLGGGFVPGSSVLLVGAPGAGKSTLALEVLRCMRLPSLYVTGEESAQQLTLRADRLGARSGEIFLLFETNLGAVIPHIASIGAQAVVVDSLQTMYTEHSSSLPGTPTQLRECIGLLRRAAHAGELVLLVVGQVTKGDTPAGPRAVEHAVDVVLRVEGTDVEGVRRISATKNRFGPAQGGCRFSIGEEGVRFDDGPA